MTLIDTISEGFAAINKRPWLVLIPIVLNAYLWFGTQVSFAPFLSDTVAMLERLQQQSQDPAQSEMQKEFWQTVINGDMRVILAWLNLVPVMAPILAQPGVDWRPAPIYIDNFLDALGFIVILNTISLVVTGVFLTQIAETVRGDRAMPWVRLRRSAHTALGVLGYISIGVGVAFVLFTPLLFFAGLVAAILPPLGGLLISLVMVVFVWAYAYIYFTPAAIAVSGVGPLQAMRASFQIVRRNTWPAVGLLILLTLIERGLSIVWIQLANSLLGALIAIVASAYIGTGLMAARLMFYRERLHLWRQSVSPGQVSQ